MADQGRNIRIPGHMMEVVNRVNRVERELATQLERDPSPEEVAERAGLSVEKLLEVMQIAVTTTSLDAPVGADTDDLTVGDTIADDNSANDPSQLTERRQLALAVEQTLNDLPERDQEIVAMRFGIGKYTGQQYTLEDVAKKMNVTRERVRQIEQKTLARLRHPHNSANLRDHLQQVVATALHRNSRQAVAKLCEPDGAGGLRFRHAPPLIWRFDQLDDQWLAGLDWHAWTGSIYATYLETISPTLRQLLSHFRHSDAALKAVGVGSVGTRCAVNVLVGEHPNDVLVVQGKQAEPSVLAPYLDIPAPQHQGQRVVEGQRLLQTASDSFLGWGTNPHGQHIYFRHFRDWKGAVEVAKLDGDGLKDYGRLCGWTLAKAHARSGDRRAIAAHIREPKLFARQVLERAIEHADLAEQDHGRLLTAIAAGTLPTGDVA